MHWHFGIAREKQSGWRVSCRIVTIDCKINCCATKTFSLSYCGLLHFLHGRRLLNQCKREGCMSRHFIRVAGWVFAGLPALLVIWLLRPSSLLGQLVLCLFLGQALALYAFLGIGTGTSPMTHDVPISKRTATKPMPWSASDQARIVEAVQHGEAACTRAEAG